MQQSENETPEDFLARILWTLEYNNSIIENLKKKSFYCNGRNKLNLLVKT